MRPIYIPLEPAEQSPPRSRVPLGSAGQSPPRSRVAELPSSRRPISASLEGSGYTFERVTYSLPRSKVPQSRNASPPRSGVADLPSSEAEVCCVIEGPERDPRARRRLVTYSRVVLLPSSEAEIGHPLEGRSATLERGGDWPAGLRGTLEWAACWASLSPSLSSEGEVGRGPSWAQSSLSGVCVF